MIPDAREKYNLQEVFITVLSETYTLNNGISLPRITFGTWQVSNEDAPAAVMAALEIGYRHIDTAIQYENEVGVGDGIRKSEIARDEILVTTKIPADVKTYEGAKTCIEESITRLNIGVIDQVLIHSPKPWEELFAGSLKTYFEGNLEVWRAMEEAVDARKVRSIGVSNFEIADIENILNNGRIKPAVNQTRVHIGHTPTEVTDYGKEQDIQIMAFSPNATGKLMGHPLVTSIAEKYGVSVPHLSIRYEYSIFTSRMKQAGFRNHFCVRLPMTLGCQLLTGAKKYGLNHFSYHHLYKTPQECTKILEE